jgi:hypothetical protein
VSDSLLLRLYRSFGLIAKDKGDYDWFNKSLKVYMRTNSSDYIGIGNLYNWIGVIHEKKDDNKSINRNTMKC